MTDKVKTFVGDEQTEPQLRPRHLAKQEFGRQLYTLMRKKGWTQSELSRQAKVARDSVSTYVRGKTAPTPSNLDKLAKALGVPSEELYPNSIEMAIDDEAEPSFEIKVSVAAPEKAWLRVNRLVTLTTAARVAELLDDDAFMQKKQRTRARPSND